MILLDVFNTEAHPFKAPPTLPVYGSGKLIDSSAAKFKIKSGPLPAVSPIPKLKRGS